MRLSSASRSAPKEGLTGRETGTRTPQLSPTTPGLPHFCARRLRSMRHCGCGCIHWLTARHRRNLNCRRQSGQAFPQDIPKTGSAWSQLAPKIGGRCLNGEHVCGQILQAPCAPLNDPVDWLSRYAAVVFRSVGHCPSLWPALASVAISWSVWP